MTDAERDGLRRFAEECVALVERQFGRDLDWSMDSLEVLDNVCSELLAAGPLGEDRFDLWWQLVGAYTGEVLIAAYDGAWIDHHQAGGAFAVSVAGLTGFPFSTADRVLRGEPFESLASFGRSIPALTERDQPSW